MSSGKAPKQKESEAEKEQAIRAQNRLREWKTDGYEALESKQIADADIDHSASLMRRGNASLEAAVAQQRPDVAYSVGQGTAAQTLDDALGALGAAKVGNRAESVARAREIQDTNRLKMAKVGQNVAASLDSAYLNAANRGASTQATKVANNMLRSRARTQAIVDTLSGAAMGAMMRKPTPLPGAKYDTPETGLTGNHYIDPGYNQVVG